MTDPATEPLAPLAVTWWGHATTTVELGGTRLLLDPVLCDDLAHLHRRAPTPGPEAAAADVVLVSHQHLDHLHLPSLRRVPTDAVLVVPPGAEPVVRDLPHRTRVARPGEVLEVGGLHVEVHPAEHDGRRLPWSRRAGTAVGYRVAAAGRSVWFPGDTGPGADTAQVAPVDLALPPVGGWGPTLGEDHLDPVQAAEVVGRVGARWALPVHWGTFWPRLLDRVAPDNHRRLFVEPGSRFAAAVADLPGTTTALLSGHGRRVVLRA
ncbi:L-ascorbate metabolism protein UlaG, beta-lactamase superfamily [Nocardioides scoriae]|uniref:L-ascorbate metabolism protein UlaG, beta-lactamase superfamily n=1 Tax=Nocardioides scoriae TaxID=642780 RepID=A0A1H1W7D9_9ACTN|nr:MBL fold metallo-hydrolase [Nocardioides scoriae]SDS92882.1 L-ascorbate metabolism protein UlaG, beta-lactamase superfamily [Nocardioides scoriae]